VTCGRIGSDSGLLWAYRTFDALPAKCQKYIERIEEVVGVPIKYIGVGPEVAAYTSSLRPHTLAA
jgi:adenylosuccinate synthase